MKKTPGGEGERIEFHAWSMREGRLVLAGVGVNGLTKTHGKRNLLGQEHKQNLNSRTILWRRKRSADGCLFCS